jgi:hypothetical protein
VKVRREHGPVAVLSETDIDDRSEGHEQRARATCRVTLHLIRIKRRARKLNRDLGKLACIEGSLVILEGDNIGYRTLQCHLFEILIRRNLLDSAR